MQVFAQQSYLSFMVSLLVYQRLSEISGAQVQQTTQETCILYGGVFSFKSPVRMCIMTFRVCRVHDSGLSDQEGKSTEPRFSCEVWTALLYCCTDKIPLHAVTCYADPSLVFSATIALTQEKRGQFGIRDVKGRKFRRDTCRMW